MQHNDDKLVQLTLEGDHDAFATLVEKYQSQIHALAWRKIGEYSRRHYAGGIPHGVSKTRHLDTSRPICKMALCQIAQFLFIQILPIADFRV